MYRFSGHGRRRRVTSFNASDRKAMPISRLHGARAPSAPAPTQAASALRLFPPAMDLTLNRPAAGGKRSGRTMIVYRVRASRCCLSSATTARSQHSSSSISAVNTRLNHTVTVVASARATAEPPSAPPNDHVLGPSGSQKGRRCQCHGLDQGCSRGWPAGPSQVRYYFRGRETRRPHLSLSYLILPAASNYHLPASVQWGRIKFRHG
jgi:hypothetical protein